MTFGRLVSHNVNSGLLGKRGEWNPRVEVGVESPTSTPLRTFLLCKLRFVVQVL